MIPTAAPWAKRPTKPPPPELKPAPAFPPLLEDPSSHIFSPAATKHITNDTLLHTFLSSSSASHFIAFLLALNDSVKGSSITDSIAKNPPSSAISSLVSLLDTLDTWIDDIPPAPHSMRYGNPAYRTWHARLVQQAPALLTSALFSNDNDNDDKLKALHPAVPELASYFTDSFGNATRVDYGTGHETTFAAFLYCLARLGYLSQQSDAHLVVALVFNKYWKLLRRLQTTYWLEPAGSHGVWGLDDYHFLPFLFGSAQLMDNHYYLKPGCIMDKRSVEEYKDEYAYLEAVYFVMQVKKGGPLHETAPMLVDISGLPSWGRVNKGMMKMYQVEVLGKVPIMQHFLFGSLLPFP